MTQTHIFTFGDRKTGISLSPIKDLTNTDEIRGAMIELRELVRTDRVTPEDAYRAAEELLREYNSS